MLLVPRQASRASLGEASAFLSGTHPRLGHGSLPWKLAHRAPEILRLIVEFVLAPRRILYAGAVNGAVEAIEVLGGDRPRLEVCTVGPPQDTGDALYRLASCFSPWRVHGLAASSTWLVAAMCCGNLRAFRLPSHTESLSISLGVHLPPQAMAIVQDLVLVASKRALFVVDLAQGALLFELSLPFSARPSVVVGDMSVFVLCDEAICRWQLPDVDLGPKVARSPEQAERQELRSPHRQMLVDMVVFAKSQLVVTASPEELRCWCWPWAGGRGAQLLWALPAFEVSPAGVPEAASLTWLPGQGSEGRLLVLGSREGALVLRPLQFARPEQEPVPGEEVELASVSARGTSVVAQALMPEVVLRSQDAGWACWSLDKRAPQALECREEAHSSPESMTTCLVPATSSAREEDGEAPRMEKEATALRRWAEAFAEAHGA